MANYSGIKKVALLRHCLIVAVGGRTGKLRREVARRLDEENMHEHKTAQDHCLCLWSVETLKAQPLCEEESLGEQLVGVWEERRTIITALLELGIQRFSLSHFLCCLFAL